MSTQPAPSRTAPYVALALTALYWLWESRASGNIRVDLGLIYPTLFTAYVVALWPKARFWSIPIAVGLMLLNIGYFVLSYGLFDKNPG
jgi:hypothetical protein